MSDVLAKYYALCAASFDQKYLQPDLDEDADEVAEHLETVLANKSVLELGCGSGFWTETIAESAAAVLATDINDEMLELAQERDYPEGVVEFAKADWLSLDLPAGHQLNACFGAGVWSHVKREDYSKVLGNIHRVVGAGGLLILVDDNTVEGFTRPVARTDAEGNTYQVRQQADGARVEILKNFPTDSYLKKKFSAVARDIRLSRNEYFWMLTCVLK